MNDEQLIEQLADLEHDKLMSRKSRQFSVATRCTELQGRYLAMFTDKQVHDFKGAEPPSDEEIRAAVMRSKARGRESLRQIENSQPQLIQMPERLLLGKAEPVEAEIAENNISKEKQDSVLEELKS